MKPKYSTNQVGSHHQVSMVDIQGRPTKKSKSFPCGVLPETILIIIYDSNTIIPDVISG